MKIRIGSRGSTLALAQSNGVAHALAGLGHDTEITVIQTAGDRDQDRRFSEIGAPGVFVREIEAALLDEEIDLAVHSYKDLPSQSPAGLVVAAIPERLDPADRLIVCADPGVAEEATATAGPASPRALSEELGIDVPLPENAVVGTASERRRALLQSLRPDLQVEPIRGNVPTRLAKLREGRYQAIVLAAAGLMRLERQPDASDLGLDQLVSLRLDPAVFVPAPAQGALALQCREDDRVAGAVAPLHGVDAAGPVQAERELLRLVEGGCDLPFGAWCRRLDGGDFELVSFVESDGELVRASYRGKSSEALADRLWAQLSRKLSHTPTAGAGVGA